MYILHIFISIYIIHVHISYIIYHLKIYIYISIIYHKLYKSPRCKGKLS